MRIDDGLGASGLGRLIVGLGLIGFGVENVLFGRYIVARVAPWPDDPSARFAIACVTGALFLATGAAFVADRWLRPLGLASAALILGWSVVRHLPVAIAGPAWSGHWTNVLKAATLAAGGLGVAVDDGRPIGRVLSTLRDAAPYAVAAFFLLGGIQHFMFASFVVTLMPPFIPFPLFWTYFAGVALLAFGSGPVRGFAVVHCIGILTSMFSAVFFSRGLVNLWYGRKKKLRAVSIGTVWRPGSDGAITKAE